MGHGIGVLLFAVIGGYWLLERASSQKGQLKQVGMFLGSLVIVASVAGIVLQFWGMGACGMRKYHGGMMGKKAGCCLMGGADKAGPTP